MKKFFLLTCLFCNFAFAEVKTLNFVCDEWEGVANADGSGAYFDLIRLIFEPTYKVKFTTKPWAKAVADFKNNEFHGLVGESRTKGLVHSKYPVDQSEISAIYKKGKISDFKGPDSLKGRKLGWVRDYAYDQLSPFPLDFTEVNNVPAGLQMLLADRFEILLDYGADLPKHVKKAKLKEKDFEISGTGIFESIYVVFHPDAMGKELAAFYDQRMVELLKSKAAQKVYEKYETPFPPIKL